MLTRKTKDDHFRASMSRSFKSISTGHLEARSSAIKKLNYAW